MASIDLKEAYFSVPIANDCKKYLRFIFDSKLFEFNALPYGLCAYSTIRLYKITKTSLYLP